MLFLEHLSRPLQSFQLNGSRSESRARNYTSPGDRYSASGERTSRPPATVGERNI